jgi:hypothetical protein
MGALFSSKRKLQRSSSKDERLRQHGDVDFDNPVFDTEKQGKKSREEEERLQALTSGGAPARIIPGDVTNEWGQLVQLDSQWGEVTCSFEQPVRHAQNATPPRRGSAPRRAARAG